MPAEEIARLCQRATHGSIEKHRRRTEGADKHKQAIMIDQSIVYQGDCGDAEKTPQPRPEYLGQTYPWRALSIAPHFFEKLHSVVSASTGKNNMS